MMIFREMSVTFELQHQQQEKVDEYNTKIKEQYQPVALIYILALLGQTSRSLLIASKPPLIQHLTNLFSNSPPLEVSVTPYLTIYDFTGFPAIS